MGLADNKEREARAARAAAELARQRAAAARHHAAVADERARAYAAAQQRSNGPRGPSSNTRSNTNSGGNNTGRNNGGTQTSPSPAPVAASPVISKPAPTPPTLNLPDPPQYTGIKSAPIDTIEFIDETFSDNLIIDLLFEDVGGQELLTIARNDTVNGQSVIYQPFKNLGILQETYNPTTLLRLQETSDKFFSNFLINLRSKIPNVGRGPNGATFYLESEGQTGNAIIEFINIRSDEQIEIQIASAGIIEEIGA
jgi:hypothetical protein